MTSTEWKIFPKMNNFPHKAMWRDGSVLLRYSEDRTTVRIEDVSEREFEEAMRLMNEGDLRGRLRVMSWISESENVTQVGHRGDIPDSLDPRFVHICQSEQQERKFQLENMYGTLKAKCIECGDQLSVIKKECSECECDSVFVKPIVETDEWYECYKCGREL